MVAVRSADGTLTCSPFHVKLAHGARRGENKVIKLRINGEVANFHMKLGMAGEAFFVERTQDRVHRQYIVSPPMSPDQSTDGRSQRRTPGHPSQNRNMPGNFPTVLGVGPHPGAELLDSGQSSEDPTRARTRSADAADIISLTGSASPDDTLPTRARSSTVDATDGQSNAWTWMWGAMPTEMDKGTSGGGGDGGDRANRPAGEASTSVADVEVDGEVDLEAPPLLPDIFPRVSSGSGSVKAAADAAAASAAGSVTGGVSDEAAPTEYSSVPHRMLHLPGSSWTFSLCGHILSELPGAPEPLPRTENDLSVMMTAYKVVSDSPPGDGETLVSEQIALDPFLVVQHSGYLLTWNVAVKLMQQQKREREHVGTEARAASLSSISKEDITAAISAVYPLGGRDQATRRRPWLGQHVSSWTQRYEHLRRKSSSMIDLTRDVMPLLPISPVSKASADDEDRDEEDGVNEKDESDEWHDISVDGGGPVSPGSIVGMEKDMIDTSEEAHILSISAWKGMVRQESGVELDDDAASTTSTSVRSDTGGSPHRSSPQIGGASAAAPSSTATVSAVGTETVRRGNIPATTESSPSLSSVSSPPTALASEPPSAVNIDGLDDTASLSTIGTHASEAGEAHGKRQEPPAIVLAGEGGDTDQEYVSLQDISLEDISPEPARGDVYDSDTDSYTSLSLEGDADAPSGGLVRVRKYLYQKSLVPTQEQLQGLNLKDGANTVVFELEGCEPLTSQLFVWPEDSKIVITDIEGALAVARGGVLGFFQGHAIRDGAADMLQMIERHGYHILYMATMRSDNKIDSKQLLDKLKGLPEGPVFRSPDSLIRAFGTERTDIFKAAALRGVHSLFAANHNPFYAAFGTTPTDRVAFSRCHVPEGRIFIVDGQGELVSQNRSFKTSFQDLVVSLEQHFPDLNSGRARAEDDTFNNMHFWRVPLPPIE